MNENMVIISRRRWVMTWATAVALNNHVALPTPLIGNYPVQVALDDL